MRLWKRLLCALYGVRPDYRDEVHAAQVRASIEAWERIRATLFPTDPRYVVLTDNIRAARLELERDA